MGLDRRITLLELENFDFIPAEVTAYMIKLAKKERQECLNKITELRKTAEFENWLNQRDENLLGKYQPAAGPRCQLNNEPKQPCSNG